MLHILSTISNPSFDAALYPQTNQSMIEHWIPLVILTYVIYVYLYSHVLEIDNLVHCLICSTYMSTLKDQRSSTKNISQMSGSEGLSLLNFLDFLSIVGHMKATTFWSKGGRY
jgi:hypothetical protein